MPLDPTISLAAGRPAASGAQVLSPTSALDTVARFAGIQNALNTNRLFQQTFAARQRAGQILAGSPNLESGLQSLYGDPLTAAFAGEIANAARQGELTLTQIHGVQQEQSQSALSGFLKALPAAYFAGSPEEARTQLGRVASTMGATMSPTAQTRVLPAIQGVIDGLLSGTEGGGGMDKFRSNLVGWSTAGGVTPEVLSSVTGKPFSFNRGDATVSGVQAPPVLGGAQTIGSALPMGIAPGFQEFGKGEVAVPGVPPGGTPPLQAINPLEAGPQGALGPAGPEGDVGPPGLAAGALGMGKGVPSVGAARVAGDGNPLFTSSTSMLTPNAGRDATGGILRQTEQREQEKELAKEYMTGDKKSYENAVITQGQLIEMGANLDHLIQGGPNMLQPGPFGEVRTNIAKGVNLLFSLAGAEPPIDPAKVGSAEDLIKLTSRMGLSVLTQALGNQREAAQTISNIQKAVPGISNTYLGAKLISDMLNAGAQRVVDQREWQNEWRNRPANGGALAGSLEAFNSTHPSSGYISPVLSKYGLSLQGFTSQEAVASAVHQGLLTKKQAETMINNQWPGYLTGAPSAPAR